MQICFACVSFQQEIKLAAFLSFLGCGCTFVYILSLTFVAVFLSSMQSFEKYKNVFLYFMIHIINK